MGMKKALFGFAFGLMILLASGTLAAMEPVSLALDLDVTMRWPVDVNKTPTEDLTKIAGFCVQADLRYEGGKLGELSGCWMLKDPFDPTRLYDEIAVSGTLVVTGVVGQCSMTGQGIAMAVGEDPLVGNLAVRLITNLTDCTGGLSGFEGLIDGGGTDNLYDQTFTQDKYKMNFYLQYFTQ